MQGGNKVFWLVGGCPPQLLYRAAAALEVCDLDRNCLTRGRGEHPGSGVSWRLRNPLINDEVVIDPYLGAIISTGSELIHTSRGKRDRAPQAHGPIIYPYLRNRSTRTPISGDHPTVGPGKPQRVRGGGTGPEHTEGRPPTGRHAEGAGPYQWVGLFCWSYSVVVRNPDGSVAAIT